MDSYGASFLAAANNGGDLPVGLGGLAILFLVLILFVMLLQAGYLWIGAKMIAGRPTTFGQAFRAAVTGAAFNLVAAIGCVLLIAMNILPPKLTALIFFILLYGGAVVITARAFRVSLVRGLLIQIAPLVILLLLSFIFGILGGIFGGG